MCRATSKIFTQSGGPNCADIYQMDIGFWLFAFISFLADALLASSLLERYDKLTPSSAAMCFRQTTLSNLYTEIIAHLMHCGVSDVQSLFLRFTAFVVAGHFIHSYILFHHSEFKALLKMSCLAPPLSPVFSHRPITNHNYYHCNLHLLAIVKFQFSV